MSHSPSKPMISHSKIEEINRRLKGHECIQVGIGHNETILYFDDGSLLNIERKITPEAGGGLDAITKIALSSFTRASSTSDSVIQLEFTNGRLWVLVEDDDHESMVLFDAQKLNSIGL
jgi:hypothetical protein